MPTPPEPTTWPRPYLVLDINKCSDGSKGSFARGHKRFELAGRWGYRERTQQLTTLNGALTSSATSVPVTSASDIEVLDTLLVNNEQMYVTAILTDTLTVERGVNGTHRSFS